MSQNATNDKYKRDLELLLKEEDLAKIDATIKEENVCDDNQVIARKLILLRKSKKISRVSLAKETNLSESTIKKYENGDLNTPSKTIDILADYFNVPVAYITKSNSVTELDYQFISALKVYCWQLTIKVGNTLQVEDGNLFSYNEIRESVAKAALTAIRCIPDTEYYLGHYLYVCKCLIESDEIEEVHKIKSVKDAKGLISSKLYEYIGRLQDEDYIKGFSLDDIFRIIEFVVCTLTLADKEQYYKIISQLKPLIDNYRLYLKRNIVLD